MPQARTTVTAIGFSSPAIRVFLSVFVPLWAMSFCPLSGGAEMLPGGNRWAVSDTSTQVDQLGDRLQMIGVNTAAHAAQMVDLQTFRDWADVELIRQSMDESQFPFRILSDSAVSLSVQVAEPEPATGIRFWQHVRHQSFERGFRHAQFYNFSRGVNV